MASFGANLMKKMKGDGDKKDTAGFDLASADLMKMMSGFTVKRLLSMMGTAGAKPLTKEEMLEINRKLNKIKKK